MELINDAQRLRTLGAYLKKQSSSWSSMSSELLADTNSLGQTWTDSQFKDLQKSIDRMNKQFIEFQKKSNVWAKSLDEKAERVDRYFKIQQG